LMRSGVRLNMGHGEEPCPDDDMTQTIPCRGLPLIAPPRTISLRPSASRSATAGELLKIQELPCGCWGPSTVLPPASHPTNMPFVPAPTTSGLPSPFTSAITGEPRNPPPDVVCFHFTAPVRASRRSMLPSVEFAIEPTATSSYPSPPTSPMAGDANTRMPLPSDVCHKSRPVMVSQARTLLASP